jgi:hypothetical protein
MTEPPRSARRRFGRWVATVGVHWVIVPACLYATAFYAMTYPWIRHFGTHFFCDAGDGLQNVWNLWWVRKALVELHQLPWHTNWLHAPHGTSLVGHTLNPINGLLGILLAPFLPLVVVHNLLVSFAFVATGLATCWLCYHEGRRFWPSFTAGAFVTFSEYHFAHAEGHLQLVTLQFVPLFLLSWLRMLDAPGFGRALVSALALVVVLLGDHYYFGYSMVAALILLAWDLWGDAPLRRARLRAAATSLTLAGVACAPLLLRLAAINAGEGFDGSHDPQHFSVDLLALFIPGAHWFFRSLTQPLWSRFGAPHELSVHLGLPLLCLAAIGAWRGGRRAEGRIPAWLTVAAAFGIFALGPTLHVAGRVLDIPLPYALAERVMPVLRLSGVPARMMAMVVLALSVVAARGLEALSDRWRRPRWGLAIILVAAATVDLWPAPLPLTPARAPAWVSELRALPPGVVFSEGEETYGLELYYQTIYEKPRVGGFIARTPRQVVTRTDEVLAELRDHHFSRAGRRLGTAYVVRRSPPLEFPALRPLVERQGVWIYEIVPRDPK